MRTKPNESTVNRSWGRRYSLINDIDPCCRLGFVNRGMALIMAAFIKSCDNSSCSEIPMAFN